MLSGAAGAHGPQILLQIVKQIEKNIHPFFLPRDLSDWFSLESELKFKPT